MGRLRRNRCRLKHHIFAGEEELQRVQRQEDFKLLKTAANSMLMRDNLNEALR